MKLGLAKYFSGRRFVTLVAVLGIVGAVCYWQLMVAQKPDTPQTVILILVDTLRADALGCYGNPLPVSPNIDALARESVLFRQAYASSGWTLPSVASIFTGTWPMLHGASGKDKKFTPIRSDLPVATELFAQQGFNTFGITNAMFLNKRLGFDRGFDVFDHDPAVVGQERRADKCVERAIEILGENKGDSNFIFLHLFDPHLPYDPPEGYRGVFAPIDPAKPFPVYMERCLSWPGQEVKIQWASKRGQKDNRPPAEHVDYLKKVYYEEVNFVDAQLGRLFVALKEMGIYDSATIVLSADHGEEFWDHDGFEHGHTLFDELIRVPLIIKPSKKNSVAPREIVTQVRTLDIMPTLFQDCGIEAPVSFIGAPLQSLMSGENHPDREVYPEGTLYGVDQYAVRDGVYKLTLDIGATDGDSSYELYNIKDDPLEKKDISGSQSEKLEEMKARLIEHFGDVRNKSNLDTGEDALKLEEDEVERLKSLGYIR